MKTTASHNDLQKALKMTNEQYEDNIKFRYDPISKGKYYQFTLTVKNSLGKGGRIGQHGRHIAAACWHVHGDFFDNLFKVNPDAIVKTGNKTITKDFGNWEDWNIGSLMFPLYYSEACDC